MMGSMDDLRIIPITPDDDALWRRFWATWNAAAAELGPLAGRADPDERRHAALAVRNAHLVWFLAERDGEPAGAATSRLMLDSTPRSGYLDLGVLRQHRGRGVGRELARACLASQQAAGAQRLDSYVPQVAGFEDGQAGRALAACLGMVPNAVDVVREAALPLELPAAAPLADGYRLEVVTGAPDPELYDDLRVLLAAMDTDVPQGEHGNARRAWPDESLRAHFDPGSEVQWMVLARAGDGRIAGYTVASNAPTDGMRERLQQGDTVVLHQHRGHGLGMALKRTLHERACADAPWMTVGQTTNDASNEHMIAINEALGYREAARLENWTWLA